MKYLLLTFLLLFCACGDHRLPIDSIEGRWVPRSPNQPEWRYDFRGGLLTQQVPGFATWVTVYADRHDTLFIGGDISHDPTTWRIEFFGPDSVVCHPISNTPGLAIRMVRTWD